MLVSTHYFVLCAAVNLIVMANFDEWRTSPEKMALFQPTKRPPDAPSKETYANLLKHLGAIFLTKE
jgi:hypothetical protein